MCKYFWSHNSTVTYCRNAYTDVFWSTTDRLRNDSPRPGKASARRSHRGGVDQQINPSCCLKANPLKITRPKDPLLALAKIELENPLAPLQMAGAPGPAGDCDSL